MTTVLAMSTLTWIIWVAIWVTLAFWPARVASRKGHTRSPQAA